MPEMEKVEFEFRCGVCGERGEPGAVVVVDAELREHMLKVHNLESEPLSGSGLRRVEPGKRVDDILGQKNEN